MTDGSKLQYYRFYKVAKKLNTYIEFFEVLMKSRKKEKYDIKRLYKRRFPYNCHMA